MIKVSKRSENLGTENAFVVLAEVNDLIRKGKDIISFCIGQPDFETPSHIKAAGIQAIEDGKHGYTPSSGILELREAIASYIFKTRSVRVEPTDIVVGAGAKPFIMYSVLSTTDFGGSSTVATTYTFTIRLTDAEGQTTDREFSLTSSFGATGGGQFN